MMHTKAVTKTLGTIALVALTSGCYPGHHRGHHGHGGHHGDAEPIAALCGFATCLGLSAMGAPPEVAIAGAVVAGVVVLDNHDSHWHGNGCGCQYRWWNGNRVYWYGGRWEYHDGNNWCAVDEGGGRHHGRGPSW